MKEQEVLQRFYKVSINLGPYRVYSNSKVYEIHSGKNLILPGVPYSILTILFGWWGFSITKPFRGLRNSLEALHINFSGGEDITKLVTENDYDERTNTIYNNILAKTKETVTRNDIEIITEIQDEFVETKGKTYSEENLNYIILNLSKLDIHRITREHLRDIFDAVKFYYETE